MKLRGPKLLARKYTKPEQIKGIWTNPAWRVDNSRSLWEVVESTPDANEVLGVDLEPDWILVTSPNSGVFLHHDSEEDDEGRTSLVEVFLLAASSVLRVIPWTTDSEDVLLTKGKILVDPDWGEEVKSGLIVRREDVRPKTGVVEEVGPEVSEAVAKGFRVCFTEFSGTEVEIGGRKKLILDEQSILATF